MTGAAYTLSVFVVMGDNSTPRASYLVNANVDFSIILGGNLGAANVVVPLGNSLYRLAMYSWGSWSAPTSHGVIRYSGQSAKAFRVTGWQIERGVVLHPYRKVA